MRISLEWLSDYVALPRTLSPQEIAHTITMSTVEVESVDDLAASLEGVVVGRIMALARHPQADRLQVAEVDVGPEGTRTVVCGATNIHVGLKVALALPAAWTIGKSGKKAQLGISEIRGVKSVGMICSSVELGLELLFETTGDRDIIDLTEVAAEPGTPLSGAIGYSDHVLEVDNKSLTNRPDLWGHYGVARELAALFVLEIKPIKPCSAELLEPTNRRIRIDPATGCQRYSATTISGLPTGTSPLWLRSRLARVGQRPLSLPVDLTNFVMFAVGQPCHVFDADFIGDEIEIAPGRGSEFELLDGRTISGADHRAIVYSRDKPLALAGVMGGTSSAISESTQNIVLEVGTFDPIQVRRDARDAGVRTESASRFDKGQSPALVPFGLSVFLDQARRVAPEVTVLGHADSGSEPAPVVIETTGDFLRRRTGLSIDTEAVTGYLARLGFEVDTEEGDRLVVGVPWWRATGDVSIPEDLVEELARMMGYEKIPFVPPRVELVRPIRQHRTIERRLHEYLAFSCGIQQVFNYPWVETSLQAAAGLPTPPLQLASPPTPETSRLQNSLVPGLLGAVSSNLRFFDSFRLFEIAKVFRTKLASDPSGEELRTEEPKYLAAAWVGADAGQLLLEAKGVILALPRAVGSVQIELVPESDGPPWCESGSALAVLADGTSIGCLAVVCSRTRRLCRIPSTAASVLLEMDLTKFGSAEQRAAQYAPIPEHPEISEDLSFLVSEQVQWSEIAKACKSASSLIRSVEFVDEYRGDQVGPGSKSLTLRLVLRADDRTLTSAEAAPEVDTARAILVSKFGATLRE